KAEDELPAINGLDTKDGLTRVAGNRKLYLKLLRMFVEEQGQALERIAAALAKEEASVAERLAHTLKGVAGNIGAKGVQMAAGSLEKAIRDKLPCAAVESAKQAVAATLDPLIAQLRATDGSADRQSPAKVAAAVVDPAKSREAAASLTTLLAEFDPGA